METKINGSTQPNFVPIPIATLKDTKLSLQAKGLLLFLYTVEQINKTDLANNLKIDPPQLDLLLDELVEKRYLFLGEGEYFLSFFGSFKVLSNYDKFVLCSPHTPLPPHNIMDIILGKVEDTLVRKKTKKGGENQINLSTIDERERKFKEKLVKYCIGYGGTYEVDLVKRFFNHYSQRTKNGKMLFETQKVFDVEKKLENWKIGDFSKPKNSKSNYTGEVVN
jgi:hypothetical protein